MSNQTTKGAAATGHHLTSQAALEVIQAGGNAFDGAIAAAFMACVCEPVLASPGGGGFAMVHNQKTTRLFDFFAQTPLQKNKQPLDFAEIEADFGTARQIFHIGHASSATPGFISGLFILHEKHARLPMAKLIAPARDAAAKGIKITSFQHYLSSVVAPILLNSPESRKVFAPGGHLHQTGETFINPDLAEFMHQLGTVGQKAFPVETILSAQQLRGHLRLQDFDNYQVVERDSLVVETAGSKIHLNPLPAAGGVMVAHALANCDHTTDLSVATALATLDQARRDYNGDLGLLLADTGPASYRGTTHICVVDDQQNVCSMTLSNGEGNGYIVDGCGFMLNNMLGEADINPGGMLGWPENTRMSSMMCPTIVEHHDGSTIALGSGGSNRIRSAIFQVLVNLLIKEQTIEQAVENPRVHIENGHLDLEPFGDKKLSLQLKAAFRDHRQWSQKNMFFGGCHIARVAPNQKFDGYGDPRRFGHFASL